MLRTCHFQRGLPLAILLALPVFSLAHVGLPLNPRDVTTITQTGKPPAVLTSIVPQPTQNWHGHDEPDYDAMYWEDTLPLHCARYDMGVGLIGFYIWFLTLAKLVQGLCTIPGAKRSWSDAIAGIVGTAYFIYELVMTSRTTIDCGNHEKAHLKGYELQPYLSQVLKFYIINAFGAGIAIGAESNLVIQQCFLLRKDKVVRDHYTGRILERKTPKMSYTAQKWAAGAYIVAIFYRFFSVSLLYSGYTNFYRYTDSSLLRPIMGCAAAIIFLLLVAIASVAYIAGWSFIHPRYAVLAGVGWLFVLSHMSTTAIGYVLLGRTADDVYGTSLVHGYLGILEAVLSILNPFLGFFFAFVVQF